METATKSKWAVIQLGFGVFGQGDTREQALADAAKWLELNGRQGGGNADDVAAALDHDFDYTSAHGRQCFSGDLVITSDADVIADYL